MGRVCQVLRLCSIRAALFHYFFSSEPFIGVRKLMFKQRCQPERKQIEVLKERVYSKNMPHCKAGFTLNQSEM